MTTKAQISAYIAAQPETKQADMLQLHKIILEIQPDTKLWFLDGKNAEGKVISNPNIGYGSRVIQYADGSTKEFYRVGMSANTSGISVYILGYDDKEFLKNNYAPRLGKASVTGYCIKYKKLADIHLDVLQEALTDALSI